MLATPTSQSSLSRAPSRYRRKVTKPGDSDAPLVPSISSAALESTPAPPTASLPQPLPPPPAAAHVEPISLGYRKVYHKDSANAPVDPPSTDSSLRPPVEPQHSNNPFINPDVEEPAQPQPTLTTSSTLSDSSRTTKPPLSTVFNPLNPFLAALPSDASPRDAPSARIPATTSVSPPPKDPSSSNHEAPLTSKTVQPDSPFEALQEKIQKSTRKLETNSHALTNNISKPSKGHTLDQIHTQHAAHKANLTKDKVTVKFHYPDGVTDSNGSTSFVETLSLDQTFTFVIKTVVIRHKHVLESSDPDDYMLWEICPSLGLRRAVRSNEFLRFVHGSWPSVTSNYLQLDSSNSRLDVASVAFLVPRRDIIQSAGPSGPTFYARCHYQVGPKSWKRVHLVLSNGSLTISRKSPAEQLKNKDKRTVSQISQFDLYEVVGTTNAHPGRYLMAIRSQLRGDIFVDKKDCVYVFATDDSNDYNVFRNIVFTLRSQMCEKEVRDHKDSLTKDSNILPPASSIPDSVSRSYKNGSSKDNGGSLSSRMASVNLNGNGAPNLSQNSSSGSAATLASSSSGDPFASATPPRSSSPSNNHGLGINRIATTGSRPHRAGSNTSHGSNGSNPSSPPPQHETLLSQQQQRKTALAQQGIEAPLPISTKHSRPTLIDSISAPANGYNGTYTGSGPLPAAHSQYKTQKHGFKGLVASIGGLGSPHNNVDVDDMPSALQIQDQGDGKVFKPDSLLAQMASGANAPSVAAVAAAAGVHRDEYSNRELRRGSDDREYHYRSSDERDRDRAGLSRSGTMASRSHSQARQRRLGRTLTVSGGGQRGN